MEFAEFAGREFAGRTGICWTDGNLLDGRNHPHHESFAGQGSDGKARNDHTYPPSSTTAFPHLFCFDDGRQSYAVIPS